MEKFIKFLKRPITSTILAILCGVIVSGVILALVGYNPVSAFVSLLNGIFSRPKYIFKVIERSTPIILTGISVAFSFKAGLFNIGAEGQYILGSIAATIVGISFNLHPLFQVPLVIFSGVLAGAIWGLITGFLKAKFGIHEVILGIMLNWIAFHLCNFIVNHNLYHKPNSSRTHSINSSGFTMILNTWKRSKDGIEALRKNKLLSDILLKTDLNVGFIVAVLVAVVVWFILKKTTLGFAVRAVGLNPSAAKIAGIGIKRNITSTIAISGAISGLAAALVITGTSPHALYQLAMFENIGFNGLSVALIANSSPIGCIFSGLFFSGLIYGGNSIQSDLNIPSEIISITIGSVLFFVALTKCLPMLIGKFSKRGETHVK